MCFGASLKASDISSLLSQTRPTSGPIVESTIESFSDEIFLKTEITQTLRIQCFVCLVICLVIRLSYVHLLSS